MMHVVAGIIVVETELLGRTPPRARARPVTAMGGIGPAVLREHGGGAAQCPREAHSLEEMIVSKAREDSDLR